MCHCVEEWMAGSARGLPFARTRRIATHDESHIWSVAGLLTSLKKFVFGLVELNKSKGEVRFVCLVEPVVCCANSSYLSMQYWEFEFWISIFKMYTIAMLIMTKTKIVIHCSDCCDFICWFRWLTVSLSWFMFATRCCWFGWIDCFAPPLCDMFMVLRPLDVTVIMLASM